MGRVKRWRKKVRKCVEDEESYLEVINLQKWMRLKNMKLKVVSFPGAGRGVISSKKVEIGEELVAVPLRTMVTMDVVNRSLIPQIFSMPTNTPQLSIALWLIYENHLKEESSFYSYLSILPKTFDSLLFCTDNEILALPAWIRKPLCEKLKEASDGYEVSILSLVNSCCDHCGLKYLELFTYDRFLWAWSCVNTRCVYYENEILNEVGETVSCSSLAMAPFLDFFNHSNSAVVEAKLDCQRGVYSLRTNKPYKKYEQIFIKYGAFSNCRLLIEYGFILDDDDQDVVEFSFDEVIAAAKCVNYNFADISKLKYKFITINSLNVKLSKSKDEFSWNCNGLLYILITKDTNLAELLSKTYSSTWSEQEEIIIREIQEKLVELKQDQLESQLHTMERIQCCSEGFALAKKLVKQYVNILKGI